VSNQPQRGEAYYSEMREWGTFTPHFDALVTYRTSEGRKLSPCARLVFGMIWRYSRMSRGVCDASLETYEDETGFARSTLKAAIKELCDEAFIQEVTPEGLRTLGKDGRGVLTGTRAFIPTTKVKDLEGGSNADCIGVERRPPQGSNADPEETRTKKQEKKTPNPKTLYPQTDQGRARKRSQFVGAGRNAAAIQRAIDWEDDTPGERSKTPPPIAAAPPPNRFASCDTFALDLKK
jgi:hypothetical protein